MRLLIIAAASSVLLLGSNASAQRALNNGPEAEPAEQEGWSYESGYEQPTPRMIIQQRAQARAMARIRRIETMNAYGMSNSRPIASSTPHTGLYSPMWQMPGGRPFGWYTTRRPQYILWR